ncbi:MAG: hypothetical protein ABIO70_21815 [Pseudomonadota bacterium]
MRLSSPDASPERRPPRWAWALLLAVLVPLLPLLLQQAVVVQHDISMSDLLHSHLPFRAALGRIVAGGHLPLWMPDVFSGVPLWAQIEAGAAFAPHVLLFALFPPFVAENLSIVLEVAAAAAGAWLLARRLGTEARAAALAGLAYAWCGFMVTHVRHPNMHAAAALLPWVLWAGERMLVARGRRGGPLLGLLLALQLSAGHPQVSYLTGLALAGRVVTAWPGAWRDHPRQVAALAGAVVLGGGLAAALLLPSWAFTRAAMGEVAFDWTYATAFPLPPTELKGMLWPPLVGSMEGYDYRGAASLPWGNYGYVGLGTLALAGLGLVVARRRTALALGVAVALATVLALGDATPLFKLAWTVLPGADLFRFANRFLLIAELGLALLAALGLSWALRKLGARAATLLVVVVHLAVLADLAHHARVRMPMDARGAWDHPHALRDLLPAEARAGRTYTLDELDLWERAFHAARGFREGVEPYRALWEVPLCSSGVLLGLRSASGYVRMLHHRSAAFWQLYERPSVYPRYHPPERSEDGFHLDPRLRALLDRGGVSVVVSATPLGDPGLAPLGQATLLAYENQRALPRAYLATRWQPVDDLRGAAAWMLREGLDQPAVPALEGGDPPPERGIAILPLHVEEDGPNHLSVTLPPIHPAGLLVVADSWDEGWSATVDGEPAALLPANGYQRGLLVPAGARVVAQRYWPVGLTRGLWISLAAGLGLLGWALVERRGR